MASIGSAVGAIEILSSPPSKRKYDVARLEPNGDDATATEKRVKIGSGPSMKESDSCSEVDLVSPERQVLAPNADGDVGEPSEKIKQSGGYTNGNPATLPKVWAIFSLIDAVHTPSAAEPDFGVPDEHSVRIIVPQPARAMVKPLGPGRPSSTYRNRDKTVRSGPDRPQQPSSPTKPFDLISAHARQLSVDRDTEQAVKRRKIMDVPGSPDGSADDILYERTRNTTASSRPTKTVASGIPPLERRHPEFSVNEFKRVESRVNSSRPRRRPDGQRSSTQSSPEATIMVAEEIEDSEDEFAKPPERYTGTARLFPSRAEKERHIRDYEQRRMDELRSGHFIEPSTKSNISGSSRETQGSLDREKGSGQAGIQNGKIPNRGRLTRHDSISDDELSIRKSGSDLKKANTGTVMSQFVRSPTSGSMSRDGDIRSSLPRQNQRKPLGKAGKSGSEERPRFAVTYLRAIPDLFTRLDGEEPYYLQYNPGTSQVELTTDDPNNPVGNKHPDFAFNPSSVTKIVYSDENSKMVVWVMESNTKTGSLPKLLLEVDSEALYSFLMFLQGSSDAEVKNQSGDKLNNMFSLFTEKFDKYQSRNEPNDLNLLKQRRNQRHQASDTGLTSGGKRPGNFDSSTEPPRNKKLHERLQNESSDNESSRPEGNSIETRRSIERSKELGGESIFRQFGRNGDDNNNRPTTRATRGQNREIHIRTPSPQRYTNVHRDWQRYWAGGDEPLIFPLEGTNKAQVDKRDIERLDEGEYLNDNLIAFYLRYLQDKAEKERPDVFKRVFFMNTFFYPRLIQGKGRKNIDYDAVKRWTSKVNVFAYDYVVVPVNENNHWYVAIICNVPKLLVPPEEKISKEEEKGHEKEVVDLGDAGDTTSPAQRTFEHKERSVTPEVARKVSRLSIEDRGSPEPPPNKAKHIDIERINPGTPNHTSTADDDTDRSQKATSSAGKGRKGKRKSIPPVRKYNTEEPRIITLDSFGLPHSPTCSNLRDFLIAEAKEKLGVEITLAQPSIGMTAKHIPQQTNLCDCGLFLLGYVEGFLDHPDETIHGLMQGRADMASSFPKMNAPDMRNAMRELIFELRRDQIKKEHAAKLAKKATKKAEKAKEDQATGESKSVSSASTSPRPAVPPKPEAKATEEPASASETKEGEQLTSASETKEVPKLSEEVVNVIEEDKPNEEPPSTSEESASASETKDVPKLSEEVVNVIEEDKPNGESPSTSEESASASETKDVPKLSKEVVNIIEDEKPSKESPSTPEESEVVDSFMDILAGFEASTAKDKKATKPSPPVTAPPIEELLEAVGSVTRDETSSPKPGSTQSKYFNLTLKGQPQKFPADQNRQRKDADEVKVVAPPSTPPPRKPRQQLRSSPRNQIDIPSESSEDSLRLGMSPSFRERKSASKKRDEIPDSQGDDGERAGRKGVDKGKVVEDLTETPRTRAGDAALKRQKETAEIQKKKSGAGAVFGSQREKGRKKNPVEIEE
ncbi:hypothetical protein VE02_03971 [Pseudogymnoascus sp. 03VT05]|nr:hypothetical protein VE02_03971 [Pseudogymnoascus sp. 03VT05]